MEEVAKEKRGEGQAPLVPRVGERLDEIEVMARATGSLCRTWPQLRQFAPLGVSENFAALVYPSSMVGAAQLVHRLARAGIRWRVLGQGVNFYGAHGLPSLKDFVGVSLRLLDERLVFDGERVRVHTGYSLATLVRAAAEAGLSGLEGLSGLPGCVGSALRAANGLALRYLWNAVEEVVLADRGGLAVITLNDAGESELFDPQDLILAITLKLTPGEPERILTESERCWHTRMTAPVYGLTLNDKGKPLKQEELQLSSLWQRPASKGRPEGAALGEAPGLLDLIREQVEHELKAQLAQALNLPQESKNGEQRKESKR